jgi:uncharacterized membrane protein YhhN
MSEPAIVASGAFLVAFLLWLDHRELLWYALPTKTLASSLFIVAALIQQNPPAGYFLPLLVGLILCLAGDVCLALPGKRFFLAGLFVFLAGHICYLIAFFTISAPGDWTIYPAILAGIVSTAVFLYLRPRLGSMLWPVLAYVLVITVMVVGAFTVMGEIGFSLQGRLAVMAGASCFYFSDLFVALDKFVNKRFVNRLIGLPLYYTGQFLLAFSAGLL